MADDKKVQETKKPEDAVSDQIIDELDRIHMRTPRY
jgi:hypothetical protein